MLSGINQNFINSDAKPITLNNVPVVYADKPGRNRNIYPEDEIIKAIDWWQKVIKLDPTHRYSLVKHPKDESEESFELLAGFIKELRYDTENKCLRFDVELLPTTWGLLISYLSANGYPVGVSLRGNADPEVTMMTINNKPMEVTIRKNLKLEGIDFVMYPSYITTQVTKENVKESRKNKSITKVIENFKKEYNNQISLEDLKKLDTVFNNELNSDIKNVGGKKMESGNIEKMQFEVDKLNVSKERLQMDIEKLESGKNVLQEESSNLQNQIDTLKNEIQSLNNNLNTSTSEFTIISKKKIDFENELNEKTTMLDNLFKSIETKNGELEELENKINEAVTKSIDTLVVKKGTQIFNSENKPRINIISPSDRVSKTEWSRDNNEEIQKLVFLSENDDIKNKIFCNVSGNSWDGLTFPMYQLFHSESSDFDFDAVINKNALDTICRFINGREGYAIEPQEKKKIANKLYQSYKTLDELGVIKEIPGNLTKIIESKFSVNSGNYLLDNIIDSLLFNNFIDIDNINIDEEENKVTESSNDVSESVIDLKEQANAILASIAQAVVAKINGDDENSVDEVIENTVVENAVVENVTNDTIAEIDNTVKKMKLKIDGYENKVFEQFNPTDDSINIQDEIVKFSSMLLKTKDDTPTPFATTYELNNNEDLYAFFGVMKESFISGDFITSTQMMKGIIATAIATQLDTVAPIEDNNAGEPTSTEITQTSTSTDNNSMMAQNDDNTNDYEQRQQSTINHIEEKNETDVMMDSNDGDDDTDVFTSLNYAFNITSVILEKYAELKTFFVPSTNTETNTDDATTSSTDTETTTNPTTEIASTDVGQNESRELNEETQVTETATTENEEETQVTESTETQNIENENGGLDMEKLNAIIDLVNQNFETEDAISENNIIDAIGSLIQDYMESTDKIDTLTNELTESKSRLASFEFNSVKEEKTRTLEQAGVDKEVIDVAFKETTTIDELEKESDKLLKLVSKVSESTKKVELSRKGKVNIDPVSEVVEEKDQFDRLMGNI